MGAVGSQVAEIRALRDCPVCENRGFRALRDPDAVCCTVCGAIYLIYPVVDPVAERYLEEKDDK